MPLLPWNWKALALLPLLAGDAFAQAVSFRYTRRTMGSLTRPLFHRAVAHKRYLRRTV